MKRRDFAMGLGLALAAGPLAARTRAGGETAAAEDAWAKAASGALPALGRSDAFLVLRKGGLVFERYGADHGPATPHICWSMAKSFTHALVGMGVLAGKVDLDSPLNTVPHGDPKLNLRALLTLTDGLKWDEGDYDPTQSDATKELYGEGRFDGAAYTAAKSQAFPPGAHWRYSTGAFHLAAAELQARLFPALTAPAARRAAMADWIDAHLFRPLGMTTAVAEFDAAGTFVGGSWVYACARDYAKFGELYRLDGVWNGRRMLPEGWVRFARTPTLEPTYGAGFWLEAPSGAKPLSLMGGKGPLDGFSAQGHDGQVILIVPSKALVIVRLGLMDDGEAAWRVLGDWIAPVVNAFPDA